MTAQTLDRVTLAEPVQKKEYAVEKPRVPLVWKLFGLTALLIALVVLVHDPTPASASSSAP